MPRSRPPEPAARHHRPGARARPLRLGAAVLALAATLAACGGGASGDGRESAAAPPPAAGAPNGVPPSPPAAPPAPAAPRPASGAGVEAGGLAPTPGLTTTPDLRAQLASWRTTDRSGMACAHCHAPDAMDLALFDFPDADIRRRAAFHVGPADAENIVALVRAVRTAHRITPRDRLNDRPFQPGGRVLPGATHMERDWAFGQTLVAKLPTLAASRLETVEQALRARDEVLRFDVRREPVGVPFPRWSEDGFHGAERGTVNDWLPEVPPIPVDPAAAAELFALHDAYIEQPTPQRLWAIQAFNDAKAQPGTFAGFAAPGDRAAQFGRLKHGSLLVAQHLLRMEHAGVPIATAVGQPVVVSPDYRSTNFIFAVGSMANQNQPTMEDFAAPIVQALDPARTASASAFREMFTREVLVPWWVLGFVLEPGQQSVANWGEYFPQSLLGHRGSRAPYLMHHAFIFTAMQLHRTYTPAPSRNGPRVSPSLLATWFTGAPPGFTSTRDGVWANDEHRRLFERFAANATRMQLLLVTHEAEQACASAAAYSSNTNGHDMDLRIESWLAGTEVVDPDSRVVNAGIAMRAYAALERLKRGCTAAPADGQGGGLAVQMSGDAGPLPGGHAARRLEFPWPAAAGSTLRVAATGELEARFGDAYRFSIDHGPNAQGTSRLWVNGTLAVEAVPGQPARTVAVPLVAGQRASLRLEFERTRGVSQGTRVRWESPRQLGQVIPAIQLYER
jgi:hypothetical protein